MLRLPVLLALMVLFVGLGFDSFWLDFSAATDPSMLTDEGRTTTDNSVCLPHLQSASPFQQ
jgi:hypothetical protein